MLLGCPSVVPTEYRLNLVWDKRATLGDRSATSKTNRLLCIGKLSGDHLCTTTDLDLAIWMDSCAGAKLSTGDCPDRDVVGQFLQFSGKLDNRAEVHLMGVARS